MLRFVFTKVVLRPETLTKYNLPHNVASRQHGGTLRLSEERLMYYILCTLIYWYHLQSCACDQIVCLKNKSLLLTLFILNKQVLCRKFENMTSSLLSSNQFHLISKRTDSHLSVNMDNKSLEHVPFWKSRCKKPLMRDCIELQRLVKQLLAWR